MALIVLKGAGGQEALRNFTNVAVEGQIALARGTADPSQSQLLDMNILMGRGFEPLTAVNNLNTLQENSLVPRTAVLAAIYNDFDERSGVTEYEVRPGDVLGAIASDFGISLQTIISANNISNVDSIKPGTILKIPPVNGILHTVRSGDTVSSIAKRYSADQDEIITFNGLPLSGDLRIGDEIVVPGGKSPAAPARSKPIIGNVRFAGLPKFEGFFKTPATCVITQKAHGRNGVDCANKTGTPIYAAASGRVNLADPMGYNGGFGAYVRISHDNGTETLYAHMSKILVAAGESISQSQIIGYIGSTGRSTGPHLHFECHNCYNILSKFTRGAQIIAKQ